MVYICHIKTRYSRILVIRNQHCTCKRVCVGVRVLNVCVYKIHIYVCFLCMCVCVECVCKIYIYIYVCVCVCVFNIRIHIYLTGDSNNS
jgi:hypothetical protein